MSPDVFRRLLLVTLTSGYTLTLTLVWIYVHWAAAVAALLGGPALAFALSVEQTPASREPDLDAGREPLREGPLREGQGWREIGRRARAAAGDDDG